MKLNRWISATIIISTYGNAQAAFVDGVEDFIGTSVDDITWAQSSPSGNGSATVSKGYLDLKGQYCLGARQFTLGVGDTVTARAMFTEYSSNGTLITLGLTTTPDFPAFGQNVTVGLVHGFQGESAFIAGGGDIHSGIGLGSVEMTYNIGTWYNINLRRDTLSNYSAVVLTDSGSPSYGISFIYEGLPSQASVYIGVGPTARFDWVAIPESPATCLVWGGFMLLLSCGRQRRA